MSLDYRSLHSQSSPSELHMRPERRHQHRPAILVVSGIDDVLHIRAQIDPAPDVRRVIALQQVLPPISQTPIAKNKSKSTESKILRMHMGDRIRGKRHARAIELAFPDRPEPHHSARKSLVNLRE